MWYSLPVVSVNSASSSESDVPQRGHQWMTRWPLYTRPSSYRRTNASRTARESSGESVYAVRVQSADAPMALSWCRISPPVSSTNCAVRATNASRPRSKRVLPSRASCFSTTFCVAMPAWSVPGIQSASSPAMRRQRTSTSCTCC